jgi:hypothetical protein
MPASASMPRPFTAAGVSSSGWLKCVLIQSGWNVRSMLVSSGVIRSGRWHGTRLPIRMISRCGMARSRVRMASSRRSLSSSGSPPDMITSRISVCSSRSQALSNCDIGIFSGSPTFRRRVQKRQ